MPDTKEAIKKVTKVLNQVFKERSQQLTFIGGNTPLPTFNSATGAWQKSGKYPRYVLHVQVNNGQAEVGYFPDSPLKGRLGSFNGIGNGGKGVPGAVLRLVLVFAKSDGTFELLGEWEWLLLLLFAQARIGATSAETLSHLLPPRPSVNITNTEVALAKTQLFGLIPGDDTITLTDANGTATPVSYRDVGAAIQQYLTFDYSTLASSGTTLDSPSSPTPVVEPKLKVSPTLTLF